MRIEDSTISIEIKTLNSKFFDASFKLPMELRYKEIDLRQLLSRELGRGKIEFSVTLGGIGKSAVAQLNKVVFSGYLSQLRDHLKEENIEVDDEDLVPQIIRLPEVFGSDDDFWNENWDQLLEGIAVAINNTHDFRKQEGVVLAKDLTERVKTILDLLDQVQPHEDGRIEKLRAKILDQFNSIGLDNKDRFEQEMIYYLERLDISEEKIRLAAHCNYFMEVLTDEQESNGKRLNFIAQEMGREINTLGSKANHAVIQKLVILMKDELEKVKEQILNVL